MGQRISFFIKVFFVLLLEVHLDESGFDLNHANLKNVWPLFLALHLSFPTLGIFVEVMCYAYSMHPWSIFLQLWCCRVEWLSRLTVYGVWFIKEPPKRHLKRQGSPLSMSAFQLNNHTKTWNLQRGIVP